MIHPIVTVRQWWSGGEKLPPPGAGSVSQQIGVEAARHPAEPPWIKHLREARIPRSLVYPSCTLGRTLDQTADRFGDCPALIYNDRQWTYQEFLASANRMAGGLAAMGVRHGDRVVLALPNCPEYAISFFAIQKLGAVVVNVGPLMGRDDLRQVLSMTTPKVAIGLDLLAAALHEAATHSTVRHFIWVSLQCYQPMLKRLGYHWKLWHNRDGHEAVAENLHLAELLAEAPARPPTVMGSADSVAVLQPTGGTTGSLKLAMLTHRSLLANATQVSAWMGARIGQERTLAVLPMFHVYGLTLCLTTPVFNAGSIVLMTRFNARDMLDLLRKQHPTACPIVPAICNAISDLLEKEQPINGDKQSIIEGLRLCISGAAPLPRSTAERFERLTGAKVIEGYGLSEASPVTHACLPDLVRAGSIGLPLPDTHVRVVDFDDPMREMPIGEPGELLINGPQVMAGYYANPEQTSKVIIRDAAGKTWLRTGDIVRMDSDGFFYVLDRKKDMIIRSGMKVYPGRVEHVLSQHADVKEVAVIGRADAVHTELPVAVIAPQPPKEQQKKISDELRALCREHLAPYEVPVRFEFMEQLPRSAIGKLLRRELRESKNPGEPIEVPSVEEAEETIPDRPSRMSATKTPGHNGAAGHDSQWRSENGHDIRPTNGKSNGHKRTGGRIE